MSAELVLARPTPHHVAQLAASLRAADRLELEAVGYTSPEAALEQALSRSHVAATALIDAEVLCLFGVVDRSPTLIGPRRGEAWLLTGVAVDRHPLAFWRASKRIVRELVGQWATLSNRVDARYASALSFVARLGFRVSPAEPWGVHGEPFHPVVLGGAE